VPEIYEEVEVAELPDVLEAGLGKDASEDNESTSTSGEISAGAALLPSASSHVYSALIRRMSVEEEGFTSISLATSRGTSARLHNSMTKTRNGRDVCLCLALMAISYEMNSPRSMRLLDMMYPRHAALEWGRTDSFWDGIMVLLIKPNQNWATILKSLFSIGASASIHLGVISEIKGASHPSDHPRIEQ